MTPALGPEALRLDGRVFVVVGGGQGIGHAACRALAAAGARVVCTDVSRERAEAVAAETGGEAAVADATDDADVARLFQGARARHGAALAGFVDIVGMADLRPLREMTPAAWDRQQDIVLRQAFHVLRHGAEALPEGGAAVFVSSLAGLRSLANQGVYGIAKAGLNHMVAVASHEYGPQGLRVNAVAPGLVRTPRVEAAFGSALMARITDAVPLRRANEPEDIANAILFLLSDMARCITGAVLASDGGLGHVGALPAIEVGEALIRR